MRSLTKDKQQFLRFLVAGLANTAVHIVVFSLLVRFLPIALSNVLAFLTANIFSFFVASYFVFKVRTHSLRQYAHFLFVSSIGAAISYGIGTLCDHLEITSIAAPLLTAAVVAPVSYVLQRWVFWRKCPPTP